MFKTIQRVRIPSVCKIIKKSCVDTVFVSNDLHVQLWPDAAEMRLRWPIRTKHALHPRHLAYPSRLSVLIQHTKTTSTPVPRKSLMELVCSRGFYLTPLLARNTDHRHYQSIAKLATPKCIYSYHSLQCEIEASTPPRALSSAAVSSGIYAHVPQASTRGGTTCAKEIDRDAPFYK